MLLLKLSFFRRGWTRCPKEISHTTALFHSTGWFVQLLLHSTTIYHLFSRLSMRYNPLRLNLLWIKHCGRFRQKDPSCSTILTHTRELLFVEKSLRCGSIFPSSQTLPSQEQKKKRFKQPVLLMRRHANPPLFISIFRLTNIHILPTCPLWRDAFFCCRILFSMQLFLSFSFPSFNMGPILLFCHRCPQRATQHHQNENKKKIRTERANLVRVFFFEVKKERGNKLS
mmetsp:Transcript_46866/g.120769  ORF Transcript_46866/g.120769 Transcript_46866/m.120769 type:complete len:227 (-) Transcript_46866:184-864(-)